MLDREPPRSPVLEPAAELRGGPPAAVRLPLARVRGALGAIDPRWAIAAILFAYLVLGFTVLGFNRGPLQALITTAAACAFEVLLTRIFKRAWIFPLSAMITSFSLSILLNYSHDYFVLFVPVFFAIGSKYLFTFNGRHVLNPALAGVTFSLIFASELITAAPAYQWNGIASMSVFMVMLAMVFLVPQVKRGALVVSFLATFTILTALRAWIMRWHLPFETLFLGTLSSPAFFLFSFFMITDPATSPPKRKDQIVTGVLLAVVDLAFHLKQSYFTFFYAAFSVASVKLLWWQGRAIFGAERPLAVLRAKLIDSGYYQRPLLLGGLAAGAVLLHQTVIAPRLELRNLDWTLERVAPEHSGINPGLGDVLERVDPRIQHIAKWLLSVGDAVAVGDYDDDGLQDLFFTFPLKEDGERNALYRNLGELRFERVRLPEGVEEKSARVETHGLPSGAMFVDYDGDGDLDLFVTYASGAPILLKNQLQESGQASFEDVTEAAGLATWSNAMGANFVDLDRDGRLDLVVANVLPSQLPGYDGPAPLDLFRLPEPEHEGDQRMFNFMHSSWHMSNNGGVNHLYLQREGGRFELQDSAAWGLPETRWSLVIGTGDLNQDGYTDLYVANDFGPDDLYYNVGGARLENVKGSVFGSIGRDTYKGMNASVADVDNNGWLDVYVSNVHHALQAEGSLLWMFEPSDTAHRPRIEDRATQLGALNEARFGWGATLTDFDNDGWVDIAQANGMVDDRVDRRFERCPDYWYVNEKIARAPPSIHTMANMWGDIRGFCIYGKELNRLYLNRGTGRGQRFVDVAEQVGLTERTNSRGMAAVDLDNDGRRDLVITHQFQPPSIFRNVERASAPGGANAWIGLRLEGDGVRCNRSGIGSTVRVRAGESVQMREAQVVTGFSAQDDGRIHFGLGAHRGEVRVEVTWCGQTTEVREGLAPGRYHRLVMGQP